MFTLRMSGQQLHLHQSSKETGRAHARQSDTDPREIAMARPLKLSKDNPQRDQRGEVEIASSQLQRSGPKKGGKPVIEKRTISAKEPSAAEPSQKHKKRTRSSNEQAVERVIRESSKVHKKAPKGRFQQDNQFRKRKGVDGELLIPLKSI